MHSLGKRIRHIREKLTLTQQQLADKLHLESSVTISNYESDQREPNCEKLVRLSQLGNVSLDWLLTGFGPVRGWTYHPRNPKDASNWMRSNVDKGVKAVIIVSYHPDPGGGGGMMNGFILLTEKGTLSMSGEETPSGYKGGGPMHYDEVLRLLKSKGMTVGKIVLDENESSGLNKKDLATLIPLAKFSEDAIDDELIKLGYTPLPEPKKKQPPLPDNLVYIPQVAGKPAFRTFSEIKKMSTGIAFRREWIEKMGDPAGMILMKISGDSMAPTLIAGDLVLVQLSAKSANPQGGLHVIAMEDASVVRRIQVGWKKKLKVICDNSRYESYEIDADKISISGQIIWLGRVI